MVQNASFDVLHGKECDPYIGSDSLKANAVPEVELLLSLAHISAPSLDFTSSLGVANFVHHGG